MFCFVCFALFVSFVHNDGIHHLLVRARNRPEQSNVLMNRVVLACV
jgi:hypothetical protein